MGTNTQYLNTSIRCQYSKKGQTRFSKYPKTSIRILLQILVSGGCQTGPKTTTANIEERRNGMLVKSLPKTFQDFITITRKLNVPYVWIDALCIIQDDEEDWKREVGQMARIYQMNSIGEMTLNPCNIPVSVIPKRQVSSRRKVGVQFCVNSSLDKG